MYRCPGSIRNVIDPDVEKVAFTDIKGEVDVPPVPGRPVVPPQGDEGREEAEKNKLDVS